MAIEVVDDAKTRMRRVQQRLHVVRPVAALDALLHLGQTELAVIDRPAIIKRAPDQGPQFSRRAHRAKVSRHHKARVWRIQHQWLPGCGRNVDDEGRDIHRTQYRASLRPLEVRADPDSRAAGSR